MIFGTKLKNDKVAIAKQCPFGYTQFAAIVDKYLHFMTLKIWSE